MDFDFRAQYEGKDSEDLLDVLAEPNKYQPAAVAVARSILAERGVDVEAAFAERRAQWQAYQRSNIAAQPVPVTSAATAEWQVTVMDEVVEAPAVAVGRAQSWLNGLMILLALDVAWRGYSLGRWIYLVLSNSEVYSPSVLFTADTILIIVRAAGLAGGLFLLYRRWPLGWQLVLASFALMTTELVLNLLWYGLRYGLMDAGVVLSVGLALTVLYTGVVFGVLLRRDVRRLYGADKRMLWTAVAWGSGAAVLFTAVQKLLAPVLPF